MSDLNKVEVVPIQLEKHPNADSLSVVKVWNYTVVVNTQQWEGKTKAAYIPPDNLVPLGRPEFSFLTSNHIKVRRFRGILSQGLLVPVPDEFPIGFDATEHFGVKRYESPVDAEIGGDITTGPPDQPSKYDLESWFKYGIVMEKLYNGLPIVITEKIDGTNSSFTFQNGEMWCKSRGHYRKSNTDANGVEHNIYWKALKENPWIEKMCRDIPRLHLFGEIYGWVQNTRYGHSKGKISFAAFDVYESGSFSSYGEFKDMVQYYGGTIAPEIYVGPYYDLGIKTLIDGTSLLCDENMREGVVIRPLKEKYVYSDENMAFTGRLILKAVSPIYLEGKGKRK